MTSSPAASFAVVLLSANPMHDTGGGQRSTQMALEFLERGNDVLFVSHSRVTETVDLGLSYRHPNLVQRSLSEATSPKGVAELQSFLNRPDALVITQVAIPEWIPILKVARHLGAVCIYDLIDEWDSELGHGWYRRSIESRVASLSHLLVATAPSLLRDLERRTQRRAILLPNAFNSRIFRKDIAWQRPEEIPNGPTAIYIGALWGGWMDWELVGRMARELPEVTFLFIGDHRGEGVGLPENCRFLGLKAQTDLPPYLTHAQVGILPWKSDRITAATSPLKVYEYIAAGLPVVAPVLEPLKEIPGVMSFSSSDSFIDGVRKAVTTGLPNDLQQEMAEFAVASSWVGRIDALMERVREIDLNPETRGIFARMYHRIRRQLVAWYR